MGDDCTTIYGNAGGLDGAGSCCRQMGGVSSSEVRLPTVIGRYTQAGCIMDGCVNRATSRILIHLGSNELLAHLKWPSDYILVSLLGDKGLVRYASKY